MPVRNVSSCVMMYMYVHRVRNEVVAAVGGTVNRFADHERIVCERQALFSSRIALSMTCPDASVSLLNILVQ